MTQPAPRSAEPADATPPPPAGHDPRHAVDLWQRLARRLSPLLLQPEDGPSPVAALEALATELQACVAADPEWAILHLVHPQAAALEDAGVLHPLQTAILMSLIARRKEWPPERARAGVLAALTMNIAVTALQTELKHQVAPLDEAQRARIQQHPIDSAALLRRLGVSNPDWLAAVEQHHEQSDGKGYPAGLTEPHPLADALRTCDVFSAKMSARADRAAMLSPRAATEIFRQRSAGYFGATIISVLGLYPPGCLVRLASGEAAIVLARTSDPQRPEVALITDEFGQARQQPQRSSTGPVQGRQVLGAISDAALEAHFPISRLCGL